MTTGSASAADETLSLAALIALVIGSMVGAGIFTLPSKLGGASNGVGVLIAWSIATYEAEPRGRSGDLVRAAIAVVYAAAMIYAGGMKYLLLSAVIYAPGSALYFHVRREQQAAVFTSMERLGFVLVVVAALAGVYGLMSGSMVM